MDLRRRTLAARQFRSKGAAVTNPRLSLGEGSPLLLSPDGQSLFVSHNGDSTVARFDAATLVAALSAAMFERNARAQRQRVRVVLEAALA